MTTSGRFRAAPYLVVFDGQSLNIAPGAPNDYPTQLMANYPTIPWYNVAIGGASWTELLAGTGEALGQPASRRCHPYGKGALTPILIMCGGTADYNTPESDTGAECYADTWAYGDAARTAGFAKVIASTTTPASYITDGEETERLAGNALLIADASTKFDGIARHAENPALDDYNDATYYQDEAGVKVHWTTLGATEAALDAVYGTKPVLDAILAA